MKFRDVKTLEHLLKEYGATPGASAYSGFAAKAKSTAAKAKPQQNKQQQIRH